MVNSVGKKLQQSRLGKHLSIEEAARVTRIRPDKLLDLEEDNYSNFPSMSYAKGFLLLYARFLGVDVREFADSLHAPNPVSTDDYEYLNAAASGPAPPPSRRPYHFAPRRERTILPIVVFGLLAGAIGLAVYLVVSFERLGNLEDIAEKKDLSSPPAASSPAISTLPAAAETPAPVPIPALALRNPPPAIVSASPAAARTIPRVIQPLPPPVPAATFDPSREVRRAEPVFPTPPGHAAAPPPASPAAGLSLIAPAAPAATAGVVKQLSILPIRKTMVTIRKDVADSAPVFEDWLYPGAGPLKLSGHKFWIQVQDPGAVQITQDGQPVTAGPGEIQIE